MGLGRHANGAGLSRGGAGGDAGPYRALTAHYTVGRTIGEGTFGKVRKGVHRLTRTKVAIKILEKRRIKDKDDVERVSREIHILKHMKHPNIINLFEVLDTKRFVFLIMEYAAGGELFDFIVRNARVDERLAASFLHHIVNGLDYCHRANVIHRDLKPENLLLDADLNIKIVDFGLGNIQRPDGKLTTACGSPCYAPPEMIQGRPYSGPRADIWSVGVILYALLCGYLPFEDPSTSILYKKICQGRYEIADWVSLSARDLIARLLQTDPDKRLTVDDIRLHPWYTQTFCATDPGHPLGKSDYGGSPEPISEEILDEMKQLGYDTGATVNSVLNQLHDHRHASYQLLLHRYRLVQARPACSDSAASHAGEDGDAVDVTNSRRSPLHRLETSPLNNGSVTHRSRPDHHVTYKDGSVTSRRAIAGVSVKFDKDLLIGTRSTDTAKPVRRNEGGEARAVIPPLTLDHIDRALDLAITPSRTPLTARGRGVAAPSPRARPATQTPSTQRRRPSYRPQFEGLATQSPVAKIYAQSPTPLRTSHARITVKGTSATPRGAPGTARRTTSALRTPAPPAGPPPTTRPRTPSTFRSGRRTSIPATWRL